MKRLLVIAILMMSTISFGQRDTSRFIQMSGIVITDSLYRIPFTTVADLSTKRGVIADFYGYFALVVHPGDTLQFSSLGYKKKIYVVSDTLKVDHFNLVQILEADTIKADPVDVYPWPSKEQFANYFVNMEVETDEYIRARQRLTPQEMAFVATLMVSDGASSYSAYRQAFNQEMYTRGQGAQNNLLNPAAWSDFLKGIGTGRYQISQ